MTREERIERAIQSYKDAFVTPAGQRVLEDLSKFCHVNDTTHVIGDPYGSAQLEGRRQVYLRITQYINTVLGLTPEGGERDA